MLTILIIFKNEIATTRVAGLANYHENNLSSNSDAFEEWFYGLLEEAGLDGPDTNTSLLTSDLRVVSWELRRRGHQRCDGA